MIKSLCAVDLSSGSKRFGLRIREDERLLRRSAHRVWADLGCIRGTRRIVDVGPKQLATGLQFRDDLRQDHTAVLLWPGGHRAGSRRTRRGRRLRGSRLP